MICENCKHKFEYDEGTFDGTDFKCFECSGFVRGLYGWENYKKFGLIV
jgi:hypothetical protein